MHIQIRTQKLEVSDGLRELVRRRLRFAMDRFGDRVQRVTVRLADLNGPRGGVDKHCRISVVTRSQGVVVVEGTDESLPAVVTRAIERAVRALKRANARLKPSRRRLRKEFIETSQRGPAPRWQPLPGF
ncbi:HPF/RaiA family ribosome-associated protein [Haliangium ochraceum]|uniref:Ribosomal subunit interface protein n=1 Tax=Haliangium ochraceum (strain DSM 14365 / JCM 11303 / SMP-2) TaxID=502025 RepID=D0LQZ0_HALO1|nr:HPF/RaiA family ribosome-associated protein [Haliangium ochraceum]ACY15498.1 hypothetical protein Hoch_2990 [Haliangium ochraceum DSM 14365]